MELDWRDPQAFPRRVLIQETGEELPLPQQDVVAFGRLAEHDGMPANDIVLNHPNPELARRVSRWHFELRRQPDGLMLRALSNDSTLLDGLPVVRGAVVPVRAGAVIRVADTLSLHLLGGASAAFDDMSHTTLVRAPIAHSAPSGPATET